MGDAGDNDVGEWDHPDAWYYDSLRDKFFDLKFKIKFLDWKGKLMRQFAEEFLAVEAPGAQTRAIHNLPVDGDGLWTRWLHDKIHETAKMIADNPSIVADLSSSSTTWHRKLKEWVKAYRNNFWKHEDADEVTPAQAAAHLYRTSEMLSAIRHHLEARKEIRELGEEIMPALHARRLAIAQGVAGLEPEQARQLADTLYPLPDLPWHAQSVAVMMGLHDRLGRESGLSRLDREILRIICDKLALF